MAEPTDEQRDWVDHLRGLVGDAADSALDTVEESPDIVGKILGAGAAAVGMYKGTIGVAEGAITITRAATSAVGGVVEMAGEAGAAFAETALQVGVSNATVLAVGEVVGDAVAVGEVATAAVAAAPLVAAAVIGVGIGIGIDHLMNRGDSVKSSAPAPAAPGGGAPAGS